MSDLYSIISSIEPSGQDILEAELFAKQILEAKFPNLDLREGTAIRDLTLRPAAFILALVSVGLNSYFSQNTISAQTDDSPTDIVDALMGNLFLTRNTGTYSVINVRLYFARQKSVSLTTSTSFSTDGKLLFFPPATISIPQEALLLDSFLNEWYVDVDLIAGEKGSDYNLDSGSLLYFTNFDPFFLHAEINYLNQQSSDAETNTEFIQRAQSSISTRNLINLPSIDSNLRSNFNFLNRVHTISTSDPESYRDQVRVEGPVQAERRAAATSLSDGNTKLLIQLDNHDLIDNQLVNIREPISNGIVLKDARVEIVDSDNFKVLLYSPFTTPRTITRVWVAKVWEPLYVHVGGSADIYVGETVTSQISQFTLNSRGAFTLNGPVMQYLRSSTSGGTSPDTLSSSVPFTVNRSSLTSRSDISIVQDSSNNILLTMTGHPFVVGRVVQVKGWPQPTSTINFQVREILDENNVYIGTTDVDYTIGLSLTPQVVFVEPRLDYGFTTYNSTEIVFGSAYAGQTVSFLVREFDNVESVQQYLDLSENHVICANFMARGFDLYLLDMTVTIYNDPTVTHAQVYKLLDDYLATLAPGSDLVISELVGALNAGGISSIQLPLTVDSRLYTKDMFPPINGTTTDKIKPLHSSCIYKMGTLFISKVNL